MTDLPVNYGGTCLLNARSWILDSPAAHPVPSFCTYLSRVFSNSPIGEYGLTHDYLEFPDLTCPTLSSDITELNVFGDGAAIYLRKT